MYYRWFHFYIKFAFDWSLTIFHFLVTSLESLASVNNFFLLLLLHYFVVAFLKRLGVQCCVGHFGINLVIYAGTKRSNVGFLDILEIFWNKWVLNIHSIDLLKLLEKLSASVFCVPGMCAVDTHIFCYVHHIHSSFAISLQNSYLIPSLPFA